MPKYKNLTKVITGRNTRWSYANVWEPKSMDGGKPKYSVQLIISKDDTETIEAINKIGFSGNILNIAAGDGRFNNRLLELAQSVTAIDIDGSDLKVLEESCPNYLANKLSTKVVDITKKFPFDDSNFDGVFCTGTLHLFEKETILKILQ